jgi:threonine dehydrogenase-like Zn-dependent dehydrogenase
VPGRGGVPCQYPGTSARVSGGFYPANGDGDGGQGEAVRVPLADGSLVTVPGSGHSDEMLISLLTLSDVLSTGHHAAVCADVRPGGTVAAVGDGAVGPRRRPGGQSASAPSASSR